MNVNPPWAELLTALEQDLPFFKKVLYCKCRVKFLNELASRGVKRHYTTQDLSEDIAEYVNMKGERIKMHTQIKYEEDIIKELQNIPEEQILNLLSIIRIFKRSIITQRDSDFSLKKEFNEWDVLSDEALNNFEANLV